MVGTSKNAYNLGGFSKHLFSARVTYSYRSAYLNGLDRKSAIYQDGVGTVSASLNFNVTKNIQLTLEGKDLNNPLLKSYASTPDQPRAFYKRRPVLRWRARELLIAPPSPRVLEPGSTTPFETRPRPGFFIGAPAATLLTSSGSPNPPLRRIAHAQLVRTHDNRRPRLAARSTVAGRGAGRGGVARRPPSGRHGSRQVAGHPALPDGRRDLPHGWHPRRPRLASNPGFRKRTANSVHSRVERRTRTGRCRGPLRVPARCRRCHRGLLRHQWGRLARRARQRLLPRARQPRLGGHVGRLHRLPPVGAVPGPRRVLRRHALAPSAGRGGEGGRRPGLVRLPVPVAEGPAIEHRSRRAVAVEEIYGLTMDVRRQLDGAGGTT